MLCQRCNKNEVTTHYTQNVNGQITEYHLCSECAEAMGIGGMFSGFGGFGGFTFSPLGGMLGSMLGAPAYSHSALPTVERCELCGSSFSDIAERGKAGCAKCYEVFRNQLMPSIERLHGNTSHAGKRPDGGAASVKQSELEGLKEKLRQAIDAQEYEKAAEYRDRIKELEG